MARLFVHQSITLTSTNFGRLYSKLPVFFKGQACFKNAFGNQHGNAGQQAGKIKLVSKFKTPESIHC